MTHWQTYEIMNTENEKEELTAQNATKGVNYQIKIGKSDEQKYTNYTY